jgi:hypothetical protein
VVATGVKCEMPGGDEDQSGSEVGVEDGKGQLGMDA